LPPGAPRLRRRARQSSIVGSQYNWVIAAIQDRLPGWPIARSGPISSRRPYYTKGFCKILTGDVTDGQ
jgi:hypothetical protein